MVSHFKLSKEACPKTEEEMVHMSKVPYASVVGSLMYAMVYTRPDVAHAVGVVSRYMNNPGKEHWIAVKWILRYLKGTTNQELCFGGSNVSLQGYVDADMASDIDNRRSTTGYIFIVGGITISLVSKIQSVVALSTMEAEYVATIEASKEMIWLQRFLDELGKKQELADYTVTTRVPYILQRTLYFIPKLNIYSSSTISYSQHWKMGS